MAKGPVLLQPGLLLVRPQYTPNPDTGDHPENVLWFVSAQTQAPSIGQLNAMAAAFDPAWGTMMAAVMGTGRSYTGSIWTDWSSQFGLTGSSVGVYAGTNGGLGPPVPANTAILVSLHVAERWKGGHARMYLPHVGSGTQLSTDYNKLAAASITAITNAFQVINTATLGSGVLGGQSQRVYRQRQDPVHAHLMQISSFTVQPTYATQRRRLRKAAHK